MHHYIRRNRRRMNSSPVYTGELDTIMVPARPILSELMDQDAGEQWEQVQADPHRMEMVQSGLCGLLYPDIAHLTQAHRQAFFADITHIRGKAHLEIIAPKKPLEEAGLDRLSNAGTSVIAGIAYAPTQIAHTREVVQAILGRSDVINQNTEKEDLSIVFQGGARISNEEYTFAKLVGSEIAKFEHAPKKFITGGGRGIMRAPHRGSQITAIERGENDTTNCGVSCGKIIAAEPPNSIVTKLAVFEQIERRLEAFARSGHLTVFFPGGTGTFEELLYVLAVLAEERNKGQYYTFMLVGDESKREYYDVILNALEQSLGSEIIEETQLKKRICIGDPASVAKAILQEAEIARWNRRKEMLTEPTPHVQMDFQGAIHIPKGLRVPFVPTRENVAALELHHNQPMSERIVNLRRFTYTQTCVCIADRERMEVEQNGPFEVRGDPKMIQGTQELFKYMQASGRFNGAGNPLDAFRLSVA